MQQKNLDEKILDIINYRLTILRKRYKEQPNVGLMGRIKEMIWFRNQIKWMIKHD